MPAYSWIAAAAVGLTMGLSAAAQSAPVCDVTNGAVTPTVRGEGLSEFVGDIVIVCSGGTAVAAGSALPQISITVSLNTAITSRLQDSTSGSEALLIVDEPGSSLTGSGPAGAQLACATPLTGCAIVSNGGEPYDGSPGHPNVFQGVVSGNTVTFNVPFSYSASDGVGLPPQAVRVLRITNLRVNASAVAVGPVPGSVLASISAPGLPPLSTQVLTVAFVTSGLVYKTYQGGQIAPANSVDLSACSAGSYCNVAVLIYQENFATAFKTQLQGTAQNIPGTIYISESGFYSPGLATSSANLLTAGLADAGTRLKADFQGVPAGAQLWVGINSISTAGATETIRESGPFEAASNFEAPHTIDGFAVYGVPVTNGAASAVWEVLSVNPAQIDTVQFPVWVYFPAGTTPSGALTVKGSFAPNAGDDAFPGGTPAATAQSSTFPEPRFAAVLPGPPNVIIDTPQSGATVSGIVTLAGWAIDNITVQGAAIGNVHVSVDGVLIGDAMYGTNRPDVCMAFPGRAGCPNVGFTYQLNTGTLTVGPHTITVSATDTDTTPDTGSASVAVNVTVLPTAHIESPLAGSVVSGTTTVSGWAIDNASSVGTAIGGVKVLVDGVIVGSAMYGINRPDVCAVYAGRPGCPNVGFTYALDTTKFAPGTHTITVQATDTDGTPGTGSANVTVTIPTSPPAVYIDSPAPGAVVSGVVPVTGWALDTTATGGGAIASVQVKLDGTAVGTAAYGGSRPDVCAAYPGRPGCPNVGFAYQLNTGTLSPGTHLLTVSATDSNASPDTGSWSSAIRVNPVNVHIDSPLPGANVSGAVVVAGWALDNTSVSGLAIGSVQIKVDGVSVGAGAYGSSRPDVCTVYAGRPGCPNVGFTYSLNTASLSLGQHTITATATDTDGTPDTNTASVTVRVVAIPPTVCIDSPVPSSVLSGTATLSGWALDNTTTVGTAIASVQLSVDGTPVGSATYGVNRADVCDAYPGRPGCPNVGFTYPLSLSALSPGPHTIMVSATDTEGTPEVGAASVTITVVDAPPSVYIDSPSSGAVVSGTVTISGWALDNTSADGTAINNVQVKVDGIVVETAIYGTSRTDVCSAYPGRPGCPNVGFTYALNTAALTPGSHVLTVSATDGDASPDSGSWSITIQVAAPPSVHIDSPANGATVSGMVIVSGWAVDSTSTVGTAISSVQIKVDGITVGNATYGLNRSDVCAVYAGRPGCPNVGYSFVLNAAALSPGSHTLTVIATDTDGTPDTGSASITITR